MDANKYHRISSLRQTISRLKRRLQDTDYMAIKYAEGELNATEYAPIKEQRIQWRAEINRLEAEITEQEGDDDDY